MPNLSQKSICVSVILMTVAAVITAVIAFALVPEASRNEKFWLSLIAIFVSEVVTFMFPVAIISQGERARRILPFHLGTITIITIYDVGVAVLCLAALLPIPFPILLAGHLIWFMGFLAFVSAASIGAIFINDRQSTDITSLMPFAQIQARLEALNNRLALIRVAEAAQIKRDFVSLCEEAKYLSRQSLPGSESVEAELNQCFDILDREIARLENLSTTSTGNEVMSIDLASFNQAIEKEIYRIRQLFAKRETLLKHLRQIKG